MDTSGTLSWSVLWRRASSREKSTSGVGDSDVWGLLFLVGSHEALMGVEESLLGCLVRGFMGEGFMGEGFMGEV